MEQFAQEIAGFRLILDSYKGLTIDKNSFVMNESQFDENLSNLIFELKTHDVKLLWIKFDIKQSNLIQIATKNGFTFHNCETESLMMVKELVLNPIIPTPPTHTIGVGAVVVNDENQILVIKERISKIGFKLPGGHIDLGEKISTAVQREVLEETGVNVAFESIVSLGNFHPHQFGKGNIYILCKCKALSNDINIQDTQEIQEAKWVDVNEYICDEQTTQYLKEIVNTSLNFDGLKIKELDSFKNIPKKYELFFPENILSTYYSY